MANYAFRVEYSPNPKDDAQEWDVILEAKSYGEAVADMKRRYPSSVADSHVSYRFHQISKDEVQHGFLQLVAGV